MACWPQIIGPPFRVMGEIKGRRQGWEEKASGMWQVSPTTSKELGKQSRAIFNARSGWGWCLVSIPLRGEPSHQESSSMESEERLRLGFKAPIHERGLAKPRG